MDNIVYAARMEWTTYEGKRTPLVETEPVASVQFVRLQDTWPNKLAWNIELRKDAVTLAAASASLHRTLLEPFGSLMDIDNLELAATPSKDRRSHHPDWEPARGRGEEGGSRELVWQLRTHRAFLEMESVWRIVLYVPALNVAFGGLDHTFAPSPSTLWSPGKDNTSSPQQDAVTTLYKSKFPRSLKKRLPSTRADGIINLLCRQLTDAMVTAVLGSTMFWYRMEVFKDKWRRMRCISSVPIPTTIQDIPSTISSLGSFIRFVDEVKSHSIIHQDEVKTAKLPIQTP
ncbi:hypothetical protein DFS34DRAFT_646305 [Phlyctochytrium arcticum]|nr:hypothetical protein DFS34DRAFT_646305 [Phlyctochytrium arcticum]